MQRPGVQEALLADHDQEHRGRESAATGQRELRLVVACPGRRRRPLRDRAPGERERHDGQAEHRRGDDSQCHGGLAVGDADGDGERERHPRRGLREQQRAVEHEPPAARQEPPGEEARAESEDRGDQDPVERRAAREQVVLDRVPEQEGRRGEAPAPARAGSSRRPASSRRSSRRGPAGPRSFARAAARPGGRGSRSSRRPRTTGRRSRRTTSCSGCGRRARSRRRSGAPPTRPRSTASPRIARTASSPPSLPRAP